MCFANEELYIGLTVYFLFCDYFWLFVCENRKFYTIYTAVCFLLVSRLFSTIVSPPITPVNSVQRSSPICVTHKVVYLHICRSNNNVDQIGRFVLSILYAADQSKECHNQI